VSRSGRGEGRPDSDFCGKVHLLHRSPDGRPPFVGVEGRGAHNLWHVEQFAGGRAFARWSVVGCRLSGDRRRHRGWVAFALFPCDSRSVAGCLLLVAEAVRRTGDDTGFAHKVEVDLFRRDDRVARCELRVGHLGGQLATRYSLLSTLCAKPTTPATSNPSRPIETDAERQ